MGNQRINQQDLKEGTVLAQRSPDKTHYIVIMSIMQGDRGPICNILKATMGINELLSFSFESNIHWQAATFRNFELAPEQESKAVMQYLITKLELGT